MILFSIHYKLLIVLLLLICVNLILELCSKLIVRRLSLLGLAILIGFELLFFSSPNLCLLVVVGLLLGLASLLLSHLLEEELLEHHLVLLFFELLSILTEAPASPGTQVRSPGLGPQLEP